MITHRTLGRIEASRTTGTALTLAALVALLAAGCAKTVVGAKGEAVREDGAPIAVTVTDASLRKVQLETDAGPLVFETPVLAVSLKLENVGEAEHFYQPRHTTDKAINIQEPLLFVDAGPDQPPQVNITSIRLEQGLLPEQQAKGKTIKPGQSITDIYLFAAPDEDQANLLLTVPPQMHGGEKMLHIKIPYEKNELPEQAPSAVGEAVTLDGLELTVTGGETAWVELEDESEGKGYSDEPVFKVSYKIKNTGEGDVSCAPNHSHSGSEVLSASLKEAGGRASYPRVRFGGNRSVVGQVSGEESIGAGKTLEDFAVFERPPKGVDKIEFVFPGALCGSKGVAKIELPYTYETPKKPSAVAGNE